MPPTFLDNFPASLGAGRSLTGSAIDKWGKTIPIEFSTRGIRYGDKIEFLAFFRRVSAGAVPKVEAGPLELPKKGS